MEAGVEGPGTVNFDLPSRSLTVILLITFNFQHFLTSALRHNPCIIELIPLVFLVQKRRQYEIKKLKCYSRKKTKYLKRSSFSNMW